MGRVEVCPLRAGKTFKTSITALERFHDALRTNQKEMREQMASVALGRLFTDFDEISESAARDRIQACLRGPTLSLPDI